MGVLIFGAVLTSSYNFCTGLGIEFLDSLNDFASEEIVSESVGFRGYTYSLSFLGYY